MLLRIPPLIIVVVLGVLLGILRFLLLLPIRRRVPAFAELELKGPLLWQKPPQHGLASWMRRGPASVEGVREILRELAKEEKLRGLVVSPKGIRGSHARLGALAEELRRFRESGKEVVLYLREATSLELVLAPAASRVLLAPGGTVMLLGEAAALTGIRSLLDRLGVLPEFFRIGEFKTAPELFTRESASEIQRAFAEGVLDARFERLLEIVSARRSGDREWARRIVDGGPYTSGRALEAGLVDELVYPIDLPAHLGEDGERSAERLSSAAEVLRSRRWRYRFPRVTRARIALIPLAGIIRTGRSLQLPTGLRFAGEDTLVAQIEAARRDPTVRGVVVASHSRGGMASASDRVWRAVARLSKEKPTAAYVESVAASGGYLAIAGAGRIFASKGALVASIGVFSGRFALGELLSRLGIHREVIRRGENAGLLEVSEALRESERRTLQAEIEQIYEEFVDRVARGRGRSREEIRAHGEGRVFLAEDAPEALVDEIGDLPAALAWVAAQAKLPPGSYEVRVARERRQPYASLPALIAEAAGALSHSHWLWAPGLPEEDAFWDARSEGGGYSGAKEK